jgi:hypothetical protein
MVDVARRRTSAAGIYQEMTVGILFNRATALLKQRTGIGPYAGELFRACGCMPGPTRCVACPQAG